MRRTLMASIVLALMALACGGSDPPESNSEPAAAKSPEPSRDDNCQNLTQGTFVQLVAGTNFFGPDCIIVKSTATLSLRNVGDRDHNFTVSEGEFGTAPWLIHLGDVPKGETWEMKKPIGEILEPGTYDFFCSLHAAGMDGVLEVVEAFEG
jgi:plastocyanin